VKYSNGQSTSAKTASHPAGSRGGAACPGIAGAGLLVVCSALIDRHALRSAACWGERSMWTEMINAAGQIKGSASPNRICVDTTMRASRSGKREGEVDNGWLSVNRQRSVYEKCAGRPCYLGHTELMVRQLRGPRCVPYPNALDELRWRAVTLTPGATGGFGGRAGSGTECKGSGAYDMPLSIRQHRAVFSCV